MDKQTAELREKLRVLERKLGLLQESGSNCCSMTLSQCHALVEIGRAGSLSLNELAEKLQLDNSTVSRTVTSLVSRQLARRVEDPQDRRYVAITLTKQGRRQFEQVESTMSLYFQQVLKCIRAEKRGQVLESLLLLVEAMNSCDGEDSQ